MSYSRVFRAFVPELQPRAGGLLGGGLLGGGDDDDDRKGGGNLLGDPLSGLPGLGDGLSSALSPVLSPILPGPGGGKSSTEASPTSTDATTTSTDTKTTATSTSSAPTTTSETATSTSATSDTSSSTSDTQTSADTQTQTSDTASPTSTPPPAPTDSPVLPATSTITTTSSESPAATSAGANAPKGFLQNKALSVGVITAASLVGLVLIIAIATWAIRKRRNDRLHQDILDFSTAGLVSDTEKGGGGGGRFADPTPEASSTGHGSSSSSGHGAPQVQQRGMYENSGYPALPVFVPQQQAPNRAYNATPAYADRSYAFPSQEQNNTYANWGYGYGNAQQQQQSLPNPYEQQAYAGTEDAYGGIASGDAYQQNAAMAGVGAGAQGQGPQRRPSAHRKPPPQLYIPPANPIAEAVATNSPVSTVSLTKPPMQPASGMGAAQPARRTSLLNSPPGGNPPSQRERRDTLTHVELLDPSAPKVPAASPPLPDEFGAAARPPTSKDSPAEVRRLVVRNE